jgi:hypothetical protein
MKVKKRRWKGELAKPIYVGTIPTKRRIGSSKSLNERLLRSYRF